MLSHAKMLPSVAGLAAAALGLTAAGGYVAAQARTYAARLSPVPITVAMQETVAGRGAATATLTGNTLTIDGTFEGLKSPATVARLHLAPRGVRGPAVADLTVARATSGAVRGAVDLTDRQRQALEKNALYIQIHSEKAPDGNLWGWLVPRPSTAARGASSGVDRQEVTR